MLNNKRFISLNLGKISVKKTLYYTKMKGNSNIFRGMFSNKLILLAVQNKIKKIPKKNLKW